MAGLGGNSRFGLPEKQLFNDQRKNRSTIRMEERLACLPIVSACCWSGTNREQLLQLLLLNPLMASNFAELAQNKSSPPIRVGLIGVTELRSRLFQVSDRFS